MHKILMTFVCCFLSTVLLAQVSNKPAKFSFEKIIYHIRPTYGDCDIFHIQIDSSKSVLLHIESLCFPLTGFPNTVNSYGYYEATLSDKEYTTFVKILESTHLEKVIQGDNMMNDMSEITYIIYCNGRRFYFQSQTPPVGLDNIQRNLYSIYKNAVYKLAQKPFAFEK